MRRTKSATTASGGGISARAAFAVVVAAVVFAAHGAALTRPAFAAEAIATLERIEGTAFVRPAGETLWRAAKEGEPLTPGSSVKTMMKTTGFVVFAEGGSAKIMPLTEIVVDRTVREGLVSIILGVESGRAFIQTDSDGDGSQFVVKAGQAAFRARKTNAFVEAGDEGSCVDVVSGAVSMTSTIDLTQALTIESGHRAFALNDAGFLDMVAVQVKWQDVDREAYTCMAAAQEEKSADLMDEQPALPATTPTMASETQSADVAAVEEDEDEEGEEYEVIVIGSVTAKFAVAEAKTTAATTTTIAAEEEEQICETPPRIVRVTANESTIMPGSRTTSEFYECGEMEIAFAGIAEDGCGPVEKIMIQIDDSDDETYKAEGTKNWSYAANFETTGARSFKIWAVDKTGAVSADYEFRLDLEKNVEPPSATLYAIANRPTPSFGGYMKLNKSRLTDGRLKLEGNAESDRCDIDMVEVSVNDGATWARAEGRSSWSYAFVPKEGNYEFVAKAVDADKQESAVTQMVEVYYIDKTDEELLRIDFDALMSAYRDKDSGGFMDGVSSMFSSSGSSIEDRSRLDQSLNAKFNEQTSVYVRYLVSSVTVSGNTGRVMFNWDANKDTAGYTHSSTFIFDLDDEGWKLLTVADADTFLRHTDEAAYISMRVSETQLTANMADTSDVLIEVRDSAYNPVKDGTMISLFASSGDIDATVATSEGLAGATYTSGSSAGTAVITASRSGATSSASIVIVEESPPGPPPEPGG